MRRVAALPARVFLAVLLRDRSRGAADTRQCGRPRHIQWQTTAEAQARDKWE